ncbi:MAG: biotin--[acetyl-CoA-carboxylase] ligase [Candidatus Coatesbacteria bacterium]|nr:biotin--[acetyl-CoA-carboxylase] ligase [Candidatus Coatesbacteria bacterium]
MDRSWTLITLSVVDSTNTFLKEFARLHPEKDKVIVRAAFQSEGRGKGSSKWISEKGGFYFSVLDRNISITHLSLYSLWIIYIASLVMKSYDIPVKIKKPNDLYLNGKKLAGALVESSIQGEKLEWSIAGLGININNTFPEKYMFTSLLDYKKSTYNIDEIYGKLLELWIEKRTEWMEQKADYFQKEIEGIYLI